MNPHPHSIGIHRRVLLAAFASLAILFATHPPAFSEAPSATETLASWNEGPAKQAIVDFVKATTDTSSPDFVPPEERIATFDQDGTLWVEHPMYSQVVYCLDRVPALVKPNRNSPMSSRSRPCCPATARRWRSYRHRTSRKSSQPRSRA
jgi:hypothetical protein